MNIRKAAIKDVANIVALLADDPLGMQRENYCDPLPEAYYDAFENINQDKNQELMVLESEAHAPGSVAQGRGEVIGCLQLTFIQYLTYRGGIRAQIEAVRIHMNHRGSGLGEKMIQWAIERAKEKKAHVLQLTTDKKRPQAISFYQKLGFTTTHEGMKMHLD